MSRFDTTDTRSESQEPGPDRTAPSGRPSGIPMDRLSLPRGHERQPVRGRDQVFHLRESEARTLATVGTFRVVRADDVQTVRTSRDARTGDLRALTEQGLVQIRTVEVNRASVAVVVLTREGKDVLEAHRTDGDGRRQEFHAGLVKPREIAHDAQIYRLYQAEAACIEADGGRVSRVVLDYELKRDYQRFLHRADRPADVTHEDDMRAFAAASGLPIVEGHLELPDLRIEYESAEGRLESRDVELVTEHYSRGQMAGKSAAGFALYRAAGASRARGGSGRRGGTPFDPHHLERL
ncbi:MAG: hypothetical protein ABS36_06325 [Acidobacteria bacterium SCN 69-37]|nr:MAG: hypothetical protein ABS36_06325 [Acidobacteria bacterium SCN 69-37]